MTAIFRPGTDLISLLILLLLLFFFLSSKKAHGSVVLNRIGVKFGRIVLQVNMHHSFNMAAMSPFYEEKVLPAAECVHSVSNPCRCAAASASS